jgi:hypothetical protein
MSVPIPSLSMPLSLSLSVSLSLSLFLAVSLSQGTTLGFECLRKFETEFEINSVYESGIRMGSINGKKWEAKNLVLLSLSGKNTILKIFLVSS